MVRSYKLSKYPNFLKGKVSLFYHVDLVVVKLCLTHRNLFRQCKCLRNHCFTNTDNLELYLTHLYFLNPVAGFRNHVLYQWVIFHKQIRVVYRIGAIC